MSVLSGRRPAGVAAACAGALVLVGCGGADEPDGSGGGTADSITVAISSSPSSDALQAIAADFEDESGVSVEFVDIPYDQLAAQILLGARQPDQGFDVIQLDRKSVV